MICAFHLDLKVAHYRAEYLEQLFAKLPRLGYTHVCFELEDKVRLETIPEAAWVEAYTKAEVAAILQAARDAGLTPFPLVQTFGHLEYVLRHGRYAPLRERPLGHAQLCPSNPEAVALAQRMCDEVRELFDGPELLHIGADETRALGACPKCRQRVAERGVGGLFAEHVEAIVKPLAKTGTRPMMWADMVLAHPQMLELLPREVLLCDWDYWTGEGVPEVVRCWGGEGAGLYDPGEPEKFPPEFLERFGRYVWPEGTDRPATTWFYSDYLVDHGFDVMTAPTARSSGDNMFFPRTVHLANCAGGCAKGLGDDRLSGVMVTSWAIRLNHLETQWPALAMPAVVGRTEPNRRLDAVAETLGLADGPTLERIHDVLGAEVPLTTSRGAIASQFYGMSHNLPGEIAEHAADREQSDATLATLERQLAAYDEIEPVLDDLPAEHDRVDLSHWRVALASLRQKAHEYQTLIDWHRGGTKPEERAAAVEHELATVWDRTSACFATSYAPAALHRELMMRFGASWRVLMGRSL